MPDDLAAGAAPGNASPPSVDLKDAKAVCELFDRAAELNLNSQLRQGSHVRLPRSGQLVIGGDIHDHGPNLRQLARLADLDAKPSNHLIIQEFVHGPNRINGMDMSYRTLARAAILKVQYPEQVHILLANHELSQMTGDNILKDGVSVVQAFDLGLEFVFTDQVHVVRQGMGRFIRSMLLAVKCDNGLMVSHSLPPPRAIEAFDVEVINRVPRPDDLRNGGPGYWMVWGRNHDESVPERLTKAWGVEMFVMGHQPAEMGYNIITRQMLVLNSDTEHGMALPIDLRRTYTMDDLISELVPLASLV